MHEPALEGARILVIGGEDVDASASALAERLRGDGYDGTLARAPSQALAACREIGQDLIVLDLDAPAPGGVVLLEQLLPFTRAGTHVPVIGLASNARPELRERAFELGAKDLLSRPPVHEELALHVRALLETRHLQLCLLYTSPSPRDRS